MPVQIHEIASKLGIRYHDVINVAQELGINYVKMGTNTLDKITGEYLEQQLRSRLSQGGIQSTGDKRTHATQTRLQFAPESSRAPVPAEHPVKYPRTQSPSLPTSNPTPVSAPAIATPVPLEASSRTTVQNASNLEVALPAYIKFERSIRRLLDQEFPFSILSNVLLFHSEKARFSLDQQEQMLKSDYAFELDHILHRGDSQTDNLVVIECKNQTIRVQDERTWLAQYKSGPSNIQLQLKRHADALRSYVNPLSRGRSLTIDIIVVSSDSRTEFVHRQISPDVSFYLLNSERLLAALKRSRPTPMRVAQSDILNLVRLGVPLAELGHPELSNALSYIERCRRSIDVELFRAFNPTAERWAINGSAGMGKSVLLAYSLFVLTTNRRVQMEGDQRKLVDFGPEASAINLPPLGQRGVYAFALKEKQRQVVSGLYRRFVDEFAHLSKDVDLGVSRPAIRLWNGIIPKDCQVLVIDEAHDLSTADAAKLSAWANVMGEQRYLLIACDRHQKLRLVGRDEAIIDGINFSRKTKKLRLNYRNPFSIFAASLGLMFRWFSLQGPKVLPTKDDLMSGFGLTVEQADEAGNLTLSMQNDAHPANSWSHCVEAFTTPEAPLARLKQFRFKSQDVLWVRFSDEDAYFDYEQLSCFTYHNLNCAESVELTDKYIKGQDFPIVVIEGFSEDMNRFSSPESEQRMWQRRKELYICSSRATAFLFLVASPEKSAGNPAFQEINEIVKQLSSPVRDQDGFPRTWRFSILPSKPEEKRKMDVFTDAAETT